MLRESFFLLGLTIIKIDTMICSISYYYAARPTTSPNAKSSSRSSAFGPIDAGM